MAASDACFLRGDESSIDSPKCQRQLASLQTSRMLRLWLYYHHGAAAGIETYRRRLLSIEEEHSCCGWGAPLRCSPGDFYFNLTERPEETAVLVEDRPDLFWGSSGGTAGAGAASNTSAQVSPGDVISPVDAWWKHDLDGDSLLRSDLPAVEAMQRCARAHYGGWFAPSQFCLVSEDGSYRSHEAFDPIPDQSALQGNGGPGAGSGNFTAEGLAALRPLQGHGGCPYLFPVSATCLAADARRPGCAAPFQRSIAGAIYPFAPVALICALLHCLTSCCQCVLVALRKESDRLPPRQPTADPRYYRYGGKRYAHLVDGQLADIAARLPENLRLRPPSRLDREQGAGVVDGEPKDAHGAVRDSDRAAGVGHEGFGAPHDDAAGSELGGSMQGGDEHLSTIEEPDSGKTS